MDNSTLCPFCGEPLEELIPGMSALYTHFYIGEPRCEAHIFFPGGERIRERFARRDGLSKDTCPFCGGTVAIKKTAEGDTLIECTNPDCRASVTFGWLAFINSDKRPKYSAEEVVKKFKERNGVHVFMNNGYIDFLNRIQEGKQNVY